MDVKKVLVDDNSTGSNFLWGLLSFVIPLVGIRLSRVGFDLFKHLFDKFGTEIILMSDYLDPKTDEQEIMSEITTLFNGFAMRQYSTRRKLKAKA